MAPLTKERFVQMFNDILDGCLARGMHMPFIVTVVGINGSVSVVRHAKGKPAELVVDYTVGEGLKLPINILIVDVDGQGSRAEIRAPDQPPTYH